MWLNFCYNFQNILGTDVSFMKIYIFLFRNQFFPPKGQVVDNKNLNYAPNNPGYAVFGKVIDGMDVVDAIASAKTGMKIAEVAPGKKQRMSDVPIETIVIESAKIVSVK